MIGKYCELGTMMMIHGDDVSERMCGDVN